MNQHLFDGAEAAAAALAEKDQALETLGQRAKAAEQRAAEAEVRAEEAENALAKMQATVREVNQRLTAVFHKGEDLRRRLTGEPT